MSDERNESEADLFGRSTRHRSSFPDWLQQGVLPKVVSSFKVFGGAPELTDRDWQLLTANATVRKVPKDGAIIVQGQRNDFLFRYALSYGCPCYLTAGYV